MPKSELYSAARPTAVKVEGKTTVHFFTLWTCKDKVLMLQQRATLQCFVQVCVCHFLCCLNVVGVASCLAQKRANRVSLHVLGSRVISSNVRCVVGYSGIMFLEK